MSLYDEILEDIEKRELRESLGNMPRYTFTESADPRILEYTKAFVEAGFLECTNKESSVRQFIEKDSKKISNDVLI